jgi:predicted RNA methylase
MTTGKIDATRLKHDNYETPFWVVEAMVPALKRIVRNPRDILDAGAGTGNIGRVIRDAYPQASLVGVEKRRLRARALQAIYDNYVQVDFLNMFPAGVYYEAVCDLCVMNPPYKLAFEFIDHAMSLSRITVALLKLDFLASQGRADWMRKHTPAVYVIPKRPSFTPDGQTDWYNYGWFVWAGYDSRRTIDPTIHILKIKE